MQPSRIWVAALAAPAIVAPALAHADEVEDLGYEFDRVLRSGSYYVDEPQHLDPEKAAETVKKLEDVVARLRRAKADAPKLPAMEKSIAEYRAKADQAVVTLVKSDFDRERSSFQRQESQFSDPDRGGGTDDAERFAQAGTDTIERARKVLEAGRPGLTSEAGKAFVAEAEKWLAEAKAKIAAAGKVGELRALITQAKHETRDIGDVRFDQSLKLIEDALDNSDPERALQAWDAAKALVKPIRDPKFADLDEAKKALEWYAKVEARVGAELKPMLAKARVGPLVEAAQEPLRQLNDAVDNKNVEAALEARAKLREGCKELRGEWKEVPEAQAFLAEADKAMRRSDEELGDGLAISEIAAAEADVKPALARLVRAVDRKNATQVRRNAPVVRARMEGLRPFADKSRAKALLDQCEQALARVEKEMGTAIKKQIEDEEYWPKVEVDYNASSDVQRACLEINEAVGRMREGMAEKQARFDDVIGDMDEKHLENDHLFGGVAEDVDREAQSLVRSARQLEKSGDELRKLDPKNPGVDVVSKAVPRLIKRANAWKELVAKKCDYALKLAQAKRGWEMAQEGEKKARESDAEEATGMYGWPHAIEGCDKVLEQVALAVKILPDDKDEADEWGGRAKKLRAEAEKAFIDACLAGASEAAIAGDEYKAKSFVEAMKRTLPKSPENDKIAKIVSGGADARVKCEAEVKQRDELLKKRAVEASAAAREKFDAWRTERGPQIALAGTILGDLARWKGKFVEGKYAWLSDGLFDDFLEINGEIYRVDYSAEVRAGCQSAMKTLVDLHDKMLAAVAKKAGVPYTYSMSYVPEQAEFVCEIVGAASYTPTHEVKDETGRTLGTIAGTPYQVPRVVIRGLWTKYYTVVPGTAASVDGLNTEGILP